MRILTDNVITDNCTFSATNESDNYPAESLNHPFLTRIFQASTNSSVITITLDKNYNVDSLFLANHNAKNISIALKNSSGSTLKTVTPSYMFNVIAEYFDTETSVASIVITASTTETYLRIGQFAAGNYYQMPYFINSYPKEIEDLSTVESTQGGQVLYNGAAKLKTYEFGFAELTQAQESEIQNTLKNIQRPVFIDAIEGDRDNITPLYAKILEVPGTQKNNRRYTTNLVYREAR